MKTLFDIPPSITYLGTPGSGLMSKKQLDWRREYDGNLFDAKQDLKDQQPAFIAQVKQTVSRFFGAKATNTYMVPNFSFGFNTLLGGLDPTHRFLLLEEDYPSVNFPVRSRGFEHHYVQVDENLEDRILDAITIHRPTVFAFSIVQYISGIKIDLDFIKKLKRDFPDLLLIADGTQYCGTEPFSFMDSGLDVLAASGYKWMLSGYGNGFVSLSDQISPQLYRGAKAIHRHPNEPFLKDKDFLSLYFEPGHQDSLCHGTLEQSVLLMEQLGMQNIKTHLNQLEETTKAAFAARGLLSAAVLERDSHSTIFNLALDTKGYEKLLQAGITCHLRGPGIRIGFHLYNTLADLEKLIDVIDG